MKPEENKKYWNPVMETLPRERLMEIETENASGRLFDGRKKILAFIRRNFMGLNLRNIRTFEDIAKVPMTEKDELRSAQEGKEPYLYGDLLAVPPEKIICFSSNLRDDRKARLLSRYL